MPIVAGPVERDWMNETSGQFAYRCLPVLIANQSGWFVLNSHQIRVTWNGDETTSGIAVEYPDGEAPFPVSSHFGHGIVTWILPYLFRTPPGYNLLVRGPANCPKDGAYPLEGVVETDWAVGNFTMNWKLTRPGVTISFEKNEPICMIVPQRRGEIESFDPETRPLEDNPELAARVLVWFESRREFLAALRSPGSTETWQKHYFQGITPDGGNATGHQTRLKLQSFTFPIQHFDPVSGPRRLEAESTNGPIKETNMPFEPLRTEDLALVNRLLQAQPDLQDTISIIKQVSAKAKYPIASFDDLANGFGGENATITFRGRTLTMAEARSIIPSYYFPIASESDLTAKMADLAKALPPISTVVVSSPIDSAIKLTAASAVRPTTAYRPINVDEILRAAGASQKPGAGGLKYDLRSGV